MRRSILVVSSVVVSVLVGCASAYTKEDSTANSIAVRNEAVVLDLCATDDAGTCVPSMVRARTSVAFCANQREVTVHSAPFDGGIPCQTTP